MIYPKFPQRYLAAIVFCFILTLAALGAVFLIYLFNCANQSPLIFASSGINEFNSVAAKPPNYFYNDDGVVSQQQQQQQQEQHHVLQQQLHGQEQQKLLQQIVAATSEESSRFMQNDVDDGDLDVDDEGPQTAVLQQQIKLKQQQHVPEDDAETTLLYHQSQTPEIFENFKQQHLADTADGSSDAAEDGEEDVADTEDNSSSRMNDGNGDEKNYEQQKQQMLSSNSNDNIDTIYIDDNERSPMSNSRQQHATNAKQHTDDTNDDDGGNANSSNNMEKLSTRREDFTRINTETRKYRCVFEL